MMNDEPRELFTAQGAKSAKVRDNLEEVEFEMATFKDGTPLLRQKKAAMAGALGGLLLLTLQASGCAGIAPPRPQGAEAATTEPAVQVQVVEAKVGQMTSVLSYSGDVKPKSQVSLSAKTMGRIEELSVDVGSNVSAGEIIGRLEKTSLETQSKQAEAALAVAKARMAQMKAGTRAEALVQSRANLDSAREKLVAMEQGGRNEAVAQAEAVVHQAEARLAQLKAGPTPQQLDQAEAAVRAARNQLYAAQSQADALLGSAFPTNYTREMKEAQSGVAYEQIVISEARLAELKAGATAEQISQAQAAVDQARAALEMARNPFTEHDLNQVKNAVVAAEQQVRLAEAPFTKDDFAVAEATVAQAQANVDFVRAQLADTNIVAPMDGVVTEKNLSVGSLASPQLPIVTIISTDLEIAIPIEESRSGLIGVGQPVAVAVASQSGKTFEGAISSVSPAIDPRSRTFTARVTVTDDQGNLKSGMFARVNISTSEKQGIIVAPEQAVIKRGTENSVFVVADGRARVRRVELGTSDGQNVEIKSGVQAGEKVVVSNTALRDGDAVSETVR